MSDKTCSTKSTFSEVARFQRFENLMWAVLGPKGETLISAAKAPYLDLNWLAKREHVQQMAIEVDATIGCLSWSPQGDLLATSTYQGLYQVIPATLQVWDSKTGEERFSRAAGPFVAWNASGTELASGISRSECKTWDQNGSLQREMSRSVIEPEGITGLPPAPNAAQDFTGRERR